MTDAITERERPEDSPSVSSEPTATPAPDNDLDSLLAEFDAKTAQQTEPVTGADVDISGNTHPGQSVDPLAELLRDPADQQRITELTGQVESLRAEEFRRGELQAFNDMAADLQQHMPSWAPPDYAEMRLKALAHDPELCLAWDLRNADKSAAKEELLKVQWELAKLHYDKAPDPKRVQELQQYGYRLQVAVNSAGILRKARLDIINEAAKLKPPIDEDATQTHIDVAAAVRGASRPIDLKEPPPDFSGMSDAEFRDFTRRNYGF
jgi:hypothetical protein